MTDNQTALVIDKQIDQQSVELQEAFDQRRPMALREGFTLKDLESYQLTRDRYRTRYGTRTFAAFVEQVKREGAGAQCPVYVDEQQHKARAFFNLGDPGKPGHGDHTAALELRALPEYQQYCNRDGDRLGQRELAEWLDDWAHCLTCLDADGNELQHTAVVNSVRRIEIEGASEVTSSVGDYSSESSAMDRVAAKNQQTLPARIRIRCHPFEGFELREPTLRVSLVTGDKPKFVLRAVAHEVLQQLIADEFVDKLQTELPDAYVAIGALEVS